MKINQLVSILIVTLLTAGCVKYPKANYAEWRGAQPVGEPVGAVTTINGVEFWRHGVPNRAFTVVAVIDQDFVEDQDYINRAPVTVAKAVREHGADAVVLRGEEITMGRVRGSVGMYGGSVGQSGRIRMSYWVIKYTGTNP